MSIKQYKMTRCEAPPLHKSRNGYYQELGVYNCTTQDIVIINRFGEKIYVRPTSGMHTVQHVEVRINTLNGHRQTGTGVSKIDTKANGIIIDIAMFDLERSPVYVTEADLVICLPDNINDAPHPKFYASYENALDQVYSDLKQSVDKQSVRIFANDPSKTINELFAFVEGVIIKLPVTHYEGQDSSVFYIYNGGTGDNEYVRFQIPIDDVLKGDGFVVRKGRTYYIAKTEEQILAKIREHQNNYDNAYTEDEVQSKIKEEVQPLKTQLSQKDQALAILKETHRQEMDQAKKDTHAYKVKYEEVDAILQARGPIQVNQEQIREQIRKEQAETRKEQQDLIASLRKEIQDVRKEEHEDKIEKVKLQKSELATKSEKTKLIGTIFKYILPPLIAAGGTFLAMRRK